MPEIIFGDKTIYCLHNALLRDALLSNTVNPHNGLSKKVNCHGNGTCGTCAVAIQGAVSPMSTEEKVRLSLPPHSHAKNLRLACQVRVLGNCRVIKHAGMWGSKIR